MSFERHPWNTGFEWPQHQGAVPGSSPEEQALAFDERGFFVLEDALDAETVSKLDAEIAPFDEQALEFLRRAARRAASASPASTTVSIACTSSGTPPRCAFCASQLLADLCHDLVGPMSACTGTRLSTSSRTAPNRCSGIRTTATRTSSRRRI